jgi:hypothetical protein
MKVLQTGASVRYLASCLVKMWKMCIAAIDQFWVIAAQEAVIQTTKEERTKKRNRSIRRMKEDGNSTVKMNMDPEAIKYCTG